MKPPILDGRDSTALLASLVSVLPGYTPELAMGPIGPSQGLFSVLSRYGELVAQGLDRAPEKGFLGFLETMGIGLLAPEAARAPLVFTLADNSPIDPPLAANSEVAVQAPPPLPDPSKPAPGPDDPVVFSTTESISLMRAKLTSLQSRVASTDRYAEHAAALQSGFRLFADPRPVAHHLYLGHDSLLALQGVADVTLAVGTGARQEPPRKLTRPERRFRRWLRLNLDWEYWSRDGWIAFDPVKDTTSGLTLDGEVRLSKLCGPDADTTSINGVKSYWLRARVRTPLPLLGGDDRQLPAIRSLGVQVAFGHTGIPLDAAFVNGSKVDPSKDFRPFGRQPQLGSELLIACDDAFSREGAEIDLNFSLATPGQAGAGGLSLIWEYGTAGGWRRLTGDLLFKDGGKSFTVEPQGQPSVSFLRPRDWSKTSINGGSHFWLRARIAAGDYGGPPTYSIVSNQLQAGNEPNPPIISGGSLDGSKAPISTGYKIRTQTAPLDHCVTLNGFAWRDETRTARWNEAWFRPFEPLDESLPGIYFGFDSPLPVGLVSIYVDVPPSPEALVTPALSTLGWEYFTSAGWVQLEVIDETAGFKRSGMIQFVGPPDLAPDAGPGGQVYWVRAGFKDGLIPDPIAVNGVFPNAVWATQRRTVSGEVAGYSDGSAQQTFRVQRSPILEGERVEVEEWRGAGREWESLFPDLDPSSLRYERDPLGNVTAVWVSWRGVAHLFSAGPQDRVYSLERTQGLLRFGGQGLGMAPPPGCPVAVSYDHGGGSPGNVAAGTITSLHSPVPFVQAVSNPVPAAGGAGAESLASVALRGPWRIRSRGRSLSAADYEWLALEASAEVVRTRCLPETGPDGSPQPGFITVLIVPQSADSHPEPSQELLGRVRRHLAACAPAAIAGSIRVVAPLYVDVSVLAEIVLVDPGLGAETEAQLRQELERFLNPLTGGPGRQGWNFGQSVHLSQVAEVIKAVPGVDHAVHLELVSGGLIGADHVVIPPDSLPAPGRHSIKLTLGGDR